MVIILKIEIENNPNDLLIQQNNQPRVANNNPLSIALALSSCVWPSQGSQNSVISPNHQLGMYQILISYTVIFETS